MDGLLPKHSRYQANISSTNLVSKRDTILPASSKFGQRWLVFRKYSEALSQSETANILHGVIIMVTCKKTKLHREELIRSKNKRSKRKDLTTCDCK